jgi:hypothetical protein
VAVAVAVGVALGVGLGMGGGVAVGVGVDDTTSKASTQIQAPPDTALRVPVTSRVRRCVAADRPVTA